MTLAATVSVTASITQN